MQGFHHTVIVAMFTPLPPSLPVFSCLQVLIYFFLHHCKLFPSLLLKWHLQIRVKSGRQWISNWKRHWTEDNATGSIISNRMIWNVKWCEIVAELNFMLSPSSMQGFLETVYLNKYVNFLVCGDITSYYYFYCFFNILFPAWKYSFKLR